MRGRIDEYRHCWVPITIVGSRDSSTIEAVVDTGFDGWVCLPVPVAVHLGLVLFGFQTIELADGSLQDELVFQGEVVFDAARTQVEITLTNGQDALLGTGLLADSVLTVDFVDRILDVEREKL